MHLSAAVASLQAFCNCYLREVSEGLWYDPALFADRFDLAPTVGISHVVELPLPHSLTTLALFIRYRSLVGRHAIAEVHECPAGSSIWHRLDPLSTQLRLIDEIYARQPGSPQRLELLSRVIESHQVMDRYLEHRLAGINEEKPAHQTSFIDSEQAVVTGHWLHPTPKSRQGIHLWQHSLYTPELNGRFRLQYFAARRDLVIQGSLLDSSAENISLEMAGSGMDNNNYLEELVAAGYCILPVHPLQAHWLHGQAHVQKLLATKVLLALGELGPYFTPTSSVRTVFSEGLDWMLKLSIPVKLTNSLRFNLKSELDDSIWVSQLMRKCHVEDQFPGFILLEDPAYLSLDLPGMEETGFETIFRKNPFRDRRLHHAVHSIAALTEDPLDSSGRSRLDSLIQRLAEAQTLPCTEASLCWFDVYWNLTIVPVFGIYDRNGIALEAHQQNVVIGFDSDGMPEACYYRDIQGIALLESHRETLIDLVPELDALPKIFEPNDIVQNGLGYYLIFNHLYAIIHRFGADGLLTEKDLLVHTREKLVTLRSHMNGPGIALIDLLLQSPTLPCKANLLTRIEDRDELESECELAVYSAIANPLVQKYGAKEFHGVKASKLPSP